MKEYNIYLFIGLALIGLSFISNFLNLDYSFSNININALQGMITFIGIVLVIIAIVVYKQEKKEKKN